MGGLSWVIQDSPGPKGPTIVALCVVVFSLSFTFFIFHIHKKNQKNQNSTAGRPFLDVAHPGQQRTVVLRKRLQISNDTLKLTFELEQASQKLGLSIGSHVGLHVPNPNALKAEATWNGRPDREKDATVLRKYTPVSSVNLAGEFDLVVKIYKAGSFIMPDGSAMTFADGGKASGFFDRLKVGGQVSVSGPYGKLQYLGGGRMKLGRSNVQKCNKIGLVAGGSGITPVLQVARSALQQVGGDKAPAFCLLYLNKTHDDILCEYLIDTLAADFPGQFRVTYSLDMPPAGWDGEKGFVNAAMLRRAGIEPATDGSTSVIACGPPPMLHKALQPSLLELGFDEQHFAFF